MRVGKRNKHLAPHAKDQDNGENAFYKIKMLVGHIFRIQYFKVEYKNTGENRYVRFHTTTICGRLKIKMLQAHYPVYDMKRLHQRKP